MKVSNKKNIEAIGTLLLFLIPTNLIIIIWYLLVLKKTDVVFFSFLVLLIIIAFFLAKLRYTEFENSGYVVTIKKKHPLRADSFVFPVLEFPIALLQHSYLKRNTIYLNVITSESEKLHVFRMSLIGFNSKQRLEILASLIETLKVLKE
ncbi:hypothetical protein J2X97_001398 [Epilithonimonas hungarica]|uniref:hypothetical protein n=1 Tax=Epilithonimonas hungarica TaxID=454006 RepID=UPI0012C33292|nr:hypothetical protein [Epilithonimonas hungarica]MDP9955761.1 hypothetical protein [Epilithonimonas hungarica]MPT30743.1 hypothetical protein [Chryseobacterium sp.]